MDSVRTGGSPGPRVWDRVLRHPGARTPAVRHPSIGPSVLDIAYLAGALALFVIVGLIGKAVEKL